MNNKIKSGLFSVCMCMSVYVKYASVNSDFYLYSHFVKTKLVLRQLAYTHFRLITGLFHFP
jgi:hypothetical protein